MRRDEQIEKLLDLLEQALPLVELGIGECWVDHADFGQTVAGEIKEILAERHAIPESPPMDTAAGKMQFVRNLSDEVVEDMCERIDSGDVPAEWDGIELRWWLAERFSNLGIGYFTTMLHKARYRQFKNDYIVHNL